MVHSLFPHESRRLTHPICWLLHRVGNVADTRVSRNLPRHPASRGKCFPSRRKRETIDSIAASRGSTESQLSRLTGEHRFTQMNVNAPKQNIGRWGRENCDVSSNKVVASYSIATNQNAAAIQCFTDATVRTSQGDKNTACTHPSQPTISCPQSKPGISPEAGA